MLGAYFGDSDHGSRKAIFINLLHAEAVPKGVQHKA